MKKFPIYITLIVIILISIGTYSFYTLKHTIKVEETVISHATIPESFNGIRLVQWSDTKIKNKGDLALLKQAVREINELEADIVIFTGDLFEKGAVTSDLSKQVKEALSKLEPSLAKVAVLGDVDLKQQEAITQILTGASFKVLRNEAIEIYNGSSEGIRLIGIDSLSTSPDLSHLNSEGSQSENFQLLLIHEPTLAAKVTDYPIHIQLSGHCQQSSMTNGCSQFYNGVYPFADQLILNVNQGLTYKKGLTHLLSRPTINSFLLIKP